MRLHGCMVGSSPLHASLTHRERASLPRHPQVHLDVKRDNVMVAADGRVVLVDFGTGMRVHQEDGCVDAYPGMQVGGNTHHLAPEVMDALHRLAYGDFPRGKPVLVPLGKQPVFALGVLVIEMATNGHPLPGYPGMWHALLCRRWLQSTHKHTSTQAHKHTSTQAHTHTHAQAHTCTRKHTGSGSRAG